MGFRPRILLVRSVLKPFITDITMIKIATPNMIPKNENKEIIFRKPFFLGLKFLLEISLSAFVNNLLFLILILFIPKLNISLFRI